ncbi:cation diffusion facilitator family transporter [Salinibacter ruber]|uniref:cation diffusion facilitator family transporter n=1 Tax=Salinibacter ruber TaxID=146919 RepID=UPI000E57B8CC|nr:cation diffusion facilitator family transporter [Salinibacter ruber]MCS3748971.1 cation diffusion facilitator family transporter [Salinibacter ruber]
MASSKKAIYAAILGNFAIAVTKFLGAAVSGSSAMLAEGIHSLVDTGNGGLLLLGLRRSKRPPDENHPYGYGKSLYFYTLVVAVLIFGLGGGISLYEGILHTLDPGHGGASTASVLGVTVGGLTLNTIVLGAAIVFEGLALRTALQEFKKQRGDTPFFEAIVTSKDPTTFTVVFEDTAALAGLVVALVGIHLASLLHMPVIDGIASIIIGLILCGVAAFLIWESKKLLIGEAAAPEIRDDIRRMAHDDADIASVERLLTMHMGPRALLLNMDLRFRDDLDANTVEAAVDRLERAIREAHPSIRYIFVEAGSIARTRASDSGASAAGGPPS